MNDAANDAGPGFLAFVAFFLLALILWFLMRNMNSRMRRMSYRQQAANRGDDEPQVTAADLETAGPEATDPGQERAASEQDAPESEQDAPEQSGSRQAETSPDGSAEPDDERG